MIKLGQTIWVIGANGAGQMKVSGYDPNTDMVAIERGDGTEFAIPVHRLATMVEKQPKFQRGAEASEALEQRLATLLGADTQATE